MAQKLRIVHLNATVAGGAFIAAERISNALNLLDGVESTHLVFEGQLPQNSNVNVLYQSWLERKQAFFYHAIEKLDFLRYEKDKSIRFAFSHAPIGIDITQHEVIQNADIVHLHWVNKGFLSLASIEKLVKEKTVVWTSHDMWPFTGGCYHPRGCDHFKSGCGNCQYLKNQNLDDLSSKVFQRKQSIWGHGEIAFITPSTWLKERALESSIFQSEGNIASIPNGIDTDFFSPSVNSNNVSNKDMYRLGFSAANLANPKKGFNEFLKTCNQIQQENLKIQLVVAGNGMNELPAEFAHFNADFVGYLDSPEKIRDFYQGLDLYVTTSHEENLPTTIMESVSCGVPVAAFAVGGIPEMIEPNVTGMLSELLDSNNLAMQIRSYLESDYTNKEQMATNCRNWAIDNYSLDKVAKQYIKVYRSLLK